MRFLLAVIVTGSLIGLAILCNHLYKRKRLENVPNTLATKSVILEDTVNDRTLENSLKLNIDRTLDLVDNRFILREYKKLFLSSNYKESALVKQLDIVNKTIRSFKEININSNKRIPRIGNFIEDSILHEKYMIEFEKNKKVYLDYLYDRRNKITKLYDNTRNGRLGEEHVWEVIYNFDNCLCLKDKRIEYTDDKGVHSIQMDSIIISSKGLFILEVKNVASKGQYDIKIDKTGVWRAIYPNGKEFTMDDNANKQNNRHLIYLNKLINDSLGTFDERYIEAKGITVIANSKVKVENLSENQVVICADEIYNYINKFDMKYNNIQKEYLYKFINEMHISKPKQHPIVNWITEVESVIGPMASNLYTLKRLIEEKELENEEIVYSIGEVV